MDKNSAIGIFDSGVGGVSVLRDVMRRLPRERFIYYGDNLNAPYGTKSEAEIRAEMKPEAYIGRCPEQVAAFTAKCRGLCTDAAKARADITL